MKNFTVSHENRLSPTHASCYKSLNRKGALAPLPLFQVRLNVSATAFRNKEIQPHKAGYEYLQ
ncbi:MAG: hypothetical protein V7K41_01275 [Nostoc sp.]|uniref:hypothetical protein n=1 Tax=Nostoc sp. TaxID=1180 RepID=UPI002FF953D4